MDPLRLDKEQKAIFEKFQSAVGDIRLALPDSSDEYLLKWLVARQFDVDQAERMLRTSIEWRKANRIDGLLEHWRPPQVLRDYYATSVVGHDKFYCPLWVCSFGKTDWKGLLQSVTKRDYLRYVSYLTETSLAEMKKNSALSNTSVTHQTVILDFDGLSVRQMFYKPFRDISVEATKATEANYPETLRKSFVINAPKIFTMLFAIVKPFFHQKTIDKIQVFGCDEKEWQAALLKDIDPDQLPACYGGRLKDPDGNPKCPIICNVRGQVPKSLYLQLEKPRATNEMLPLNIANHSKKRLEFPIQDENSILRWRFMTEDGDIGFGIHFIIIGDDDRDDEKIEVVPTERVDSHLTMEEGEIVCARSCTYVLEFDNSYSYLRSKKLWYLVQVELSSAQSGQ